VIDVVYRYSREVEHSDENLKKIEKLPFSFTESICHTNRT
jgi:lysine-N-methylase